jgi:hypothetical protein
MNPLSDEMKQAFEYAIYSFYDWHHHGGSERLLKIGSNPTHFKISEVCDLVVDFDDEKLPDRLQGFLVDIADMTRAELKEAFDRLRTYHAGAALLRGMVSDQHAKETMRK